MSNSDNLAALIHRTRGAWTSDDLCALSDAVTTATPNECQLALIRFCEDLLKAARHVVVVQMFHDQGETDRGTIQ